MALFCHGGTAASQAPPKDRALSLVRMRAFERFVRDDLGGRGVETALVRYRVAGWNGEAADAYQDVHWSIEALRADLGKDVPIVLVGHSMGGRAALKAGGDPQVTAVCALAPWTPPGEPVMQLRDQTVVILHGSGDRWVPAKLSADFAVRARRAGARVARFTTPAGTACCAAPTAGTGSPATSSWPAPVSNRCGPTWRTLCSCRARRVSRSRSDSSVGYRTAPRLPRRRRCPPCATDRPPPSWDPGSPGSPPRTSCSARTT
ncbi:alpha/beta hydrolase [Klenkia terrae]|uniref:alpha/beta hydrolase n=1 Tax=Klenkia terrae TaxID=1052259 RepID=UPI00361062EE